MIFIREIIMPGDCEGFTIEDSEKNHNIYLNYSMALDARRAALEHELTHILGGDFLQSGNVENIETKNKRRKLKDYEVEGEIQYLGFCRSPFGNIFM